MQVESCYCGRWVDSADGSVGVLCQEARLGICDRIFTRVGAVDDLATSIYVHGK